jgi:hypothetical protein
MTTAAFQQETPSQSFQQKSFHVMLDQPVIRQSGYRFGNLPVLLSGDKGSPLVASGNLRGNGRTPPRACWRHGSNSPGAPCFQWIPPATTMAQPKAGQQRDFGGGMTNEITPVGFLYFRRGRHRCTTGRGSDGDDMYTAARPVRFGLRQRPAHGSCGVPRQMQVEP